jgi:hypothetical protein
MKFRLKTTFFIHDRYSEWLNHDTVYDVDWELDQVDD